MALRLAGEEFSVVQGLDGLGYVREIRPSSPDPGLLVDQGGSGRIVSFRDGGTAVLEILDAGDVVLAPLSGGKIDVRQALYNSSANQGGYVHIGDILRIDPGSNTDLLIGEAAGVTKLRANVSGGGRLRWLYGANNGFDLSLGELLQIQDADAADAVRLTINSANGNLSFKQASIIDTTVGDLTLSPAAKLDLRSAIYNAGAANGGNVKIDDTLQVDPGSNTDTLELLAAGVSKLKFNVSGGARLRQLYGANAGLDISFGELLQLQDSDDADVIRATINSANGFAKFGGSGTPTDSLEAANGINLSGGTFKRLAVEPFTEATKPAAAGNDGRIIYVSDGAAGSKFQGSDGSSWLGLG